jgi:hypothetical protein
LDAKTLQGCKARVKRRTSTQLKVAHFQCVAKSANEDAVFCALLAQPFLAVRDANGEPRPPGGQDRCVAMLLKELQAERAGINNAGFCGVAAFNAPDLEKLLPTALQICFHFFHIG